LPLGWGPFIYISDDGYVRPAAGQGQRPCIRPDGPTEPKKSKTKCVHLQNLTTKDERKRVSLPALKLPAIDLGRSPVGFISLRGGWRGAWPLYGPIFRIEIRNFCSIDGSIDCQSIKVTCFGSMQISISSVEDSADERVGHIVQTRPNRTRTFARASRGHRLRGPRT
jgi:hypothetical protein